jgi:hypothetical protein
VSSTLARHDVGTAAAGTQCLISRRSQGERRAAARQRTARCAVVGWRARAARSAAPPSSRHGAWPEIPRLCAAAHLCTTLASSARRKSNLAPVLTAFTLCSTHFPVVTGPGAHRRSPDFSLHAQTADRSTAAPRVRAARASSDGACALPRTRDEPVRWCSHQYLQHLTF